MTLETEISCKHMVIVQVDDRKKCLLCKQDLKFNKETRTHDVISPPKTPNVVEALADRIVEKLHERD
jgi:hypothetical protein